MLGMLTGSLVSSQISDWLVKLTEFSIKILVIFAVSTHYKYDRYGRKYVYLGVCMLMAFGQLLSAIAPNPFIYALARYCCGTGLSGNKFLAAATIFLKCVNSQI